MRAKRRGLTSIRFWVLLAFAAIVLLTAYYVVSDRVTPMTRDAYVQAFVIPVAPLVSGEVAEVLVENGTQVRKGDALFRIEPRGFQLELDRLQAKLDQAKAQSDAAGNQAAKEAGIRQLEAELSAAEMKLSQTTVIAATDGIVDNMQLHAGAYTAFGEPVMTLVDASRWWIVANFEENALSVIRDGQTVEFALYVLPGKVFEGKVESVGWGVERGQGIASGSLPQIENPSDWISFSQRFQVRVAPMGALAQQPMRVGATARVVVYAEESGFMAGIAGSLMRLSAYSDYLY